MQRPVRWFLFSLCLSLFCVSCINIGKHMGATLTPYTCDSGHTLEVKYPTKKVAYIYVGRGHYVLRAAPDSKTRHYQNDKYDWRTIGTGPGSEGVLSRIADQSIVERCTEDD